MPWASKAMYPPRLKTGWQEGGKGSSSIVCPLIGPLLAVVLTKGQFWGPSFCHVLQWPGPRSLQKGV